MKEFLLLLRKFDYRGLFLMPTTNGLLQFFRYSSVGGIAALADWAVLFFLTMSGLYYMISTVAGFFIGLIVNFVLSKAFVFNSSKARVNTITEFGVYALIGLIGLGLTLVLMYVLTDFFGLYFMMSKVFVTLIVLFWNYFARKISLYRNV